MAQRVLYASAPVSDAVRAARPDFLGKTAKGAWFGLEDVPALELLREDRTLSLLYPDRARYDEAMQGLDEAQTAEAVAWRLKVWSPRAKDEALPDLFEKEQGFLALLARASAKPGKQGEPFLAAFKDELEILDHLLFSDRYRGWETRDHVTAVFEGLNELNNDAEGLSGKFADKSAFPSPELTSSRVALALETQKVMQKYGLLKDIKPSGRIHVTIQRGVLITPNDPALVAGLHDSHEPVQEVKDGFVALWNDWDFASIAERGKKAELLYPYSNYLLRDLSRLTQPQLLLKIARLRKQMGPSAAAGHLAYLQLHLVLNLNNLAAVIAKKEPDLAGRMVKHASLETEELRLALIKWPVWSAEAADYPRLMALAETGTAEMAFWQTLAARLGWTSQGPELDKASDLKRKLVDRLKQANP